MHRRLTLRGGAAAVAALLSLAAAARADQRGLAIASPLECPDVKRHHGPHANCTIIPYYSPLTPIPCRWRTVVLVPYYCGYCRPHHLRRQPGYGGGDGLPGPGCGIDGPGLPPSDFGPFTGAPHDEQRLLHLGGNEPYVPAPTGAPDIIDMIRGPGPAGACPH
jgi:hypothetical protein